MLKSSHRLLPIKRKLLILKRNFIVVSGYTCGTAKGQNHKVKSVVAHIIQTLYNLSDNVPSASHLQVIAPFVCYL